MLKLYRKDTSKKEFLLDNKCYETKEFESLEGCIQDYLVDVPKGNSNYPEVVVINADKSNEWGHQDATHLQQSLGLKSF